MDLDKSSYAVNDVLNDPRVPIWGAVTYVE